MTDPFIEIRCDFLREQVDVIDAVVKATPGATRSSLMRAIVGNWVDRKLHEASLIERLRRGNGVAPAVERQRSGKTAA
jgi:hypothetical protein